MYPVPVGGPDLGGPDGHSYGAAIIPAADATLPEVQAILNVIRFSGWIAPPRDGWVVVLGDPGDRVVADGRRDIIQVGGLLAERVPGPVLAVRVRRDRQLALVAWKAGEEVARYCSDPSRSLALTRMSWPSRSAPSTRRRSPTSGVDRMPWRG